MLFIVPWEGRVVAGTSHGQDTCGPEDTAVTSAELAWFIAQVNEAFPALRLRPDEVTLVHRGVVPAARGRRGELALEGHFHLYDHAADGVEGAVSLVGVKYTTGRGVAEKAVDLVVRKLAREAPSRSPGGAAFPRRVSNSRTSTTPLPGAAEDMEPLVADAHRRAPGLGTAVIRQIVETYGSGAGRVLDLACAEPALAQPVAEGVPIVKAQVAHAVRDEMGCTLVDVVTRRTRLGAAGFPGADAARGCAAVMAGECGWDATRTSEELAALERFYLPVGPGGRG
jgi:glycerol-3-phosphate dehydrogenase